MARHPWARAGHGRAPHTRTQDLEPSTYNDNPDVKEDIVSPKKGPHRRRFTVVCPNCNTELHPEDNRHTTIVCPECDSHVPIAEP